MTVKQFIKKHSGIIGGVIVFGVLMCIALFWDLAINKALYMPSSLCAIIVESMCFIPLYAFTICLFALGAADEKHKMGVRIISGILCAIGSSALAYNVLHGFEKRAILPKLTAITVLVCGLSVAIVLILTFYFAKNKNCSKMYFLFIFGTIYMLLNNAIINLLKTIWLRTRYDDMLAVGSFDNFLAWIQPLGNGGTSFPSGHTAAAGAIFCLILCCDLFVSFSKKRKLVYAVCWIYVAFSGINRIIIGRHYLSDITAGAFIALSIVLLMKNTSIYKKKLAKIKDF